MSNLGTRIKNRVEHCADSVRALGEKCRTNEEIALLDACMKEIERTLERVHQLVYPPGADDDQRQQ